MNDVQLIRQDLKQLVSQNEKFVTDDGYPDQSCLHLEHVHTSEEKLFMPTRTRLETLKAMLKRFNVLTISFRHGVQKKTNLFYSSCKYFSAALYIRKASLLYKKYFVDTSYTVS